MKRDLDLIRKILEYVEKEYDPSYGILDNVDIPGYDNGIVVEHCRLIYDFGYINFFDDRSIDFGPACAIGNLTNDGYDILKAFNNESKFNKIKKLIMDKGGMVTKATIIAAINAGMSRLITPSHTQVVYEKGLQAYVATVEARSLHTADSQDGRMQMGDSKGCAGAHEGSHGSRG